MEHRETYYEIYVDGSHKEDFRTYEQAFEALAHYLDDDCAEIYKVEVYEERLK